MRVCFLDINGKYNALSPLHSPLGGTESAICYLARALARRGHEISILNKTDMPGEYGQVYSLNTDKSLNIEYLNSRDVIICSNAAVLGKNFKDSGITTALVFWTGHDSNQPAVKDLALEEIRSAWTKLVLVSDWQLSLIHI